jgi:hypothetical protein
MCSAQDMTAVRDVHSAILEAKFPLWKSWQAFRTSRAMPGTEKIKIYRYAGLPKYRQFTYLFRI